MMLRYLPIVMLALGLLLLSASFLSAGEPEAAVGGPICVAEETTPALDEAERPPLKLGRCWKKLGAGVLVPGCDAHGHAGAAGYAARPPAPGGRPPVTDATFGTDYLPVTDLPPPKR